MNNIGRRALSLIICAAMAVGMLPVFGLFAGAEELDNLYDSSKVSAGWVSADSESPDEGFRTSDFIEVSKGDVLYFGAAETGQGWHIVTYDSNKKATDFGALSKGISVYSTVDSASSVMKYTVGSGVSYVRFVIAVAYYENYIVTRNQAFDSAAFKKITGNANNLFDSSAATVGWTAGDGSTSPDGGFRTSDYIEVAENDVIYFGAAATGQGWQAVMFDSEKNVLGDGSAGNGIEIVRSLDTETSIMKYIVESDVKYLRFVVDAKYSERYLVTKNDPFTADEYCKFFNINIWPVTNLYDSAKASVGWVNGEGTTSPDGGFRTSDFIDVTEGDSVYFGAAVTEQGWHIVTFDADKKATGGYGTSNGISVDARLDDTTSIMKYVIGSGTKYIRFVVDARYANLYIVTKNEELTKSLYRTITDTVDPDNGDIDFDVKDDSPLIGKRALFCGDSISYGQWDITSGYGGWGKRIGEAYNMTVSNPSMGGYSISTIRQGRIIDQVNSMKNNTYDYVVLQGGVNDAWGDTETGVVAEPGKMTDSFNVEDFDITTYAGALEELFYYTYKYFDSAKIGYIITFATPGAKGIGRTDDMEPYYSEGIKICEKWGVQYLDLYHDKYVSDTLMKVKTNTYLRDPIHPNAEGYNRLSPYIGKWMEKMVDNSLLKDNSLYAKTALFCGDSISYGSSDSPAGVAWAGRIGRDNSMTVDNESQSGWSLSTARGRRIVEQFKRVNEKLYNYVILQGGVNDAWENAAVGEIGDSFDVKDFDINTFSGALEEIFYYAREYFPSAKLGYIFTFAMPRAEGTGSLGDMNAYYSAAAKICDKWNVQYLDLYHNDYINNTVLETGGTSYMADAVHPNAAGYDRLSPYIADWMKCLVYSDDVESFNAAADKLSADIKALPEDANESIKASVKDALDIFNSLNDYFKERVTDSEKLTRLAEELGLLGTAGDLDGNGEIEAADALIALQCAVGKITLDDTVKALADVNSSGDVTAADALLILQKAVGKIESFS